MKRYIFGFLIFAAMAGAVLGENAADADGDRPARNDVAVDADGEKLQGEWLLESSGVQGMMLPALAGKGGSIIFAKDGKLILKDPGKPEKIGKYKIDAGKNPKHIDLIESKDVGAMQGIYEFDGNKLKMAFSADGPKGKRPSDFKGEKVVIVHWKRQKS